jgi:hypothetical protein
MLSLLMWSAGTPPTKAKAIVAENSAEVVKVFFATLSNWQKVLDFIEGVAIPGVPPASGAGTAGYVFSREVYDPVEHSK